MSAARSAGFVVVMLGVGALVGCPREDKNASSSPVPVPVPDAASAPASASASASGSASASASASAPASASASASATASAYASPRGACPAAPPGHTDPTLGRGSCAKDADCTGGREGRCTSVYVGHGRNVNGCTYDECATDGDCKTAGTRCYCGGGETGRNACLLGNCKVDADCPSHTCMQDENGRGRGSFCRSSRDTCRDGSSCKAGSACGWAATSQRWECVPVYIRPPG